MRKRRRHPLHLLKGFPSDIIWTCNISRFLVNQSMLHYHMFITSYWTSLQYLISRVLLSLKISLQREGTPTAPKSQCKSSGLKNLKSKQLLEKFHTPPTPLPTFPYQILIGQVAYLFLSLCLSPPSGRYFSFSFSQYFFLAIYFGEPGRSSQFPQNGSHGYRRGDSVRDGGWLGRGVGVFDRDRDGQFCTRR